MRRLAIAIILPLLLLQGGCIGNFLCIDGNGDVVSEERTVNSFHGISNSASFDIICTYGATASVLVEAESNIMPYISTKVSAGILEIGTIDGTHCLDYTSKPRIFITSSSTDVVESSGSGNTVVEFCSGDNTYILNSGSGNIYISSLESSLLFKTRSSGSGDISIENISCSNSDFFISGSGDITLKGVSDKLQVFCSGSGDFFGANLVVNDAGITISGSGDVWVKADDSLNALLSGSGNIFLKGNPRIFQNVTGSGKIIFL